MNIVGAMKIHAMARSESPRIRFAIFGGVIVAILSIGLFAGGLFVDGLSVGGESAIALFPALIHAHPLLHCCAREDPVSYEIGSHEISLKSSRQQDNVAQQYNVQQDNVAQQIMLTGVYAFSAKSCQLPVSCDWQLATTTVKGDSLELPFVFKHFDPVFDQAVECFFRGALPGDNVVMDTLLCG